MITIDEEDDECDYLTDEFERQRKSSVDEDHEPDENQKQEPRKGDKWSGVVTGKKQESQLSGSCLVSLSHQGHASASS